MNDLIKNKTNPPLAPPRRGINSRNDLIKNKINHLYLPAKAGQAVQEGELTIEKHDKE
jgi:hypothetical protein